MWLLRKAALFAMLQLQHSLKMKDTGKAARDDQRTGLRIGLCVWLCNAGGDSHPDQLFPSLPWRGQGSALSGYLCLVSACAQCTADPAAPRPCGVTALNHHGFNPGAKRCLGESVRILEAAGCTQGGWRGSAGCSSGQLRGEQFLLLRSKVETSQWDKRGSLPGCAAAAWLRMTQVQVSPCPITGWR